MKFNPEEYESVKERKKRFRSDHPDGRITVWHVSTDPLEYALFEARVFKDRDDQKDNLPIGMGWALEIRDKELRSSKKGYDYESVNYTSWTENCEESAVGRALDNAGYAGNKCSREEMEKAGRMATALDNTELINVIRKEMEKVGLEMEKVREAEAYIKKHAHQRAALEKLLKRVGAAKQERELTEIANEGFGRPVTVQPETIIDNAFRVIGKPTKGVKHGVE